MQGPEKNSYKEFDNEKKFLRLESSPPAPHNFSNGPSLNYAVTSNHSNADRCVRFKYLLGCHNLNFIYRQLDRKTVKVNFTE